MTTATLAEITKLLQALPEESQEKALQHLREFIAQLPPAPKPVTFQKSEMQFKTAKPKKSE